MQNHYVLEARAKKQAEASDIGIDAEFIATLVDQFYTRVRDDAVLGPLFDGRVSDWPSHLTRMNSFWRSILLKSGEFSGNPMVKHIAIPKIAKPEFSRWLELFGQTLDSMATTPAARALVFRRAEMIAESLLLGIRIHRDGANHPDTMKGS